MSNIEPEIIPPEHNTVVEGVIWDPRHPGQKGGYDGKLIEERVGQLIALRPLLNDIIRACSMLEDRMKDSGYTEIFLQDKDDYGMARIIFPPAYESDQRVNVELDEAQVPCPGFYHMKLKCYAAGPSSSYDITADTFEDFITQYKDLLRALARYELDKIASWDADDEEDAPAIAGPVDAKADHAAAAVLSPADTQALSDIDRAQNLLSDVVGRLAQDANQKRIDGKPKLPALSAPV